MKRNNNRIIYDRGYRDACSDKRRDATIPKLIGVACLTALLVFDQYWILAFVVIYGAFELQEWHDLRKHHESKPPEQFK